MSQPAVSDTEPLVFRRDLEETIFEAIKGWEVRLPGKPLRGTTGGDAELIAEEIRRLYLAGLRESGSAGQHYLVMRGELVAAHNELDRVSIERNPHGAVLSLPERVEILIHRYLDERRRRVKLERGEASDQPAPDGWQGQPPADGTRRKLIFDTLLNIRLDNAPTPARCLDIADAIEEALERPSEPSPEYRGHETADEQPADDDAADGPFSGSPEIRIGPDGYPWISVLGLMELFEKLGTAAYRDEEVAEPGPEPGEVEEFDPGLEVSRGFAHFRNFFRHWLGL